MGFWAYFWIYAGILTYLTWGFVVAFESVLVMAGSEFAKSWVKKRYTLKFFMFEIYLFFPLVFALYLVLEVLPALFTGHKPIKFDVAKAIYDVFYEKIDEAEEEGL